MRRSRHAPIGSDKGEGDVLGEVQVVREKMVRNVIVDRMGMINRFLCGRMRCLCIFYVYLFFKWGKVSISWEYYINVVYSYL